MKKYILSFILLFSKISFSVDPKAPIMIKNLGNLCYMDATLQCLYQIQPLTDFLLTKGKNFYKKDTISQYYIDFIEEIQTSDQKSILEPKEFCKPVFKKFFKGKEFKQEDAAEFLAKFLDKLSNGDIKSDRKKIDKINGTIYSKNYVGDLFRIILNSSIVSDKCQTSIKRNIANKIDLPIQSLDGAENYDSLDECFKNFITKELLTGDNKYKCLATGELVDATKQLLIEESSDYLIIVLKRFAFDMATLTPKKLDHSVKFPLIFDLKPYMLPSKLKNIQTKYELVSFVQHSGVYGGGHYTSYVKHKDQWYFTDDILPTVEKVSNSEIKKIEAEGRLSSFDPYILFYKRLKDTKHLRELNGLNARLNSLENHLKQIS